MRPLADFSPMEIRVLGVLLEKEQTTPDYYPMTLNAIRMACNQKTNRYPVMDLGEDEVQQALESLDQYFLVARAGGTRADHWKHRADLVWNLNPAAQALLTLLFLRGPQTLGELRTRSERMHAFASVQDVEVALGELAAAPEPLARELARRPGQKEARWAAEGAADSAGQFVAPIQPEPSSSNLDQRVARLEQIVERLEDELKSLKRAE